MGKKKTKKISISKEKYIPDRLDSLGSAVAKWCNFEICSFYFYTFREVYQYLLVKFHVHNHLKLWENLDNLFYTSRADL